MKQNLSAGGVLVNEKNEVFLICKKVRDEWSLPKGGIEKGESKLEAALREVKEETGYQDIEPIQEVPIHTATWTFTREETREQEEKATCFFLFKLLDTKRIETPEMEEEGFSGDWFTFEQALEKVSFENIREVLKRTRKLLSKI